MICCLSFCRTIITFLGGTRADCQCKVIWQLCSQTHTYYIGLYLSSYASALSWPSVIEWSHARRNKGCLTPRQGGVPACPCLGEATPGMKRETRERVRWLLQMTLGLCTCGWTRFFIYEAWLYTKIKGTGWWGGEIMSAYAFYKLIVEVNCKNYVNLTQVWQWALHEEMEGRI